MDSEIKLAKGSLWGKFARVGQPDDELQAEFQDKVLLDIVS